ncbi:MAG: response regulator [Planctomycetota bacterium]|jgi:DNA-binding response OmpR family regulator
MDKKILFVDTSKRIRDALSLFFEFEKYDFLAVDTSEAALKELKNDTYDIIIADYNLPGLNGLEFLNQVKSSFPKTIEILTTAYDDRKVVKVAKEAGIKDIILKPYSAVALITHLTRLYEKELKSERQRPGGL